MSTAPWRPPPKSGTTEVDRSHHTSRLSGARRVRVKLRELHAAKDRAVLEAYGWTDVPTDCEFLLDYEVDEEESSRKKKPWRYRWPDEVRDEVLARLLELNAQRAAQEALAGVGATGAKARKGRRQQPARPDSEKPF